jgi:WD40 repeat protein
LPNEVSGHRERAAPFISDHDMLRPIGQGAYGEVWLARNALGAHRAVKVVRRSSFRDERAYEREFRGIQKYEPISRANEGLLDILQAGRNDDAGFYYYVMDLADDATDSVSAAPSVERYVPKTLSTVVEQNGRLPVADCVQLGLKLTLALGHLHRNGLIHRDIKPANIIFVQGIPQLADLGLVAAFDDTCSFVGTEGFIAPEGPTSPRADLYSLGKVLYEISTGKDRKDFPEPASRLGKGDDHDGLAELNAIILKACAANPSDRYPSAEEMYVDLALLQRGKSVKSKRILERRLALARKAGAGAALLALLATGGYLYQRQQAGEAARLQRHAEELAGRMEIQNAEGLFERGDSSLALARLAQVLRRQPDNRVAAERVMAALTQRNFPRVVMQPLRMNEKLVTARFSPDGRCIATASEDNLVRLWNARIGEEMVPPLRHVTRIQSMLFSPDSAKLVISSTDRTVWVWDVQTGRPSFEPLSHPNRASAAAVSPDGAQIATGAADWNARLFDASTGKLARAPLSHARADVRDPSRMQVVAVAFSPDSRCLACGTLDGSVVLWDVATGQNQKRLSLEAGAEFVNFSPDGKWLAAAYQTSNWVVQVWETENWQPAFKPLDHLNRIYSVKFSPDSRRLVTATANNVARVWDLTTGKPVLELRHSSLVHSAEFSADGRQILTASEDYTARVWDSSTGVPLCEPLRHDGRVVHAEFSPNGKQILTASWDKTVKLWEVSTDQDSCRTLPQPHWVLSASFDSTGKRAIVATGGGVFTANGLNSWHYAQQNFVTVWDVATAQTQLTPKLPRRSLPLVVQFTANGTKALLADEANSRHTRIFDVDAGTFTGAAIQHDADVTAAHFSPDGLSLATGSKDGVVRVWDSRYGNALTRPLLHHGRVNSVRFAPQAAMLITSSDDGTAILWDAPAGRPMAPALTNNAAVWFAQASLDGTKVVTIALDHTAKIWSTNGTLITTLLHRAPVEYAEFSPDGTKMVTASGDRTARLWNVATGQQLTEPLDHAELVQSARFSFDGVRIITASRDGTAQIWDAATGFKLCDPLRHNDWVVSASFSVDGRLAITASLDRTAKIWKVPMASSPTPDWLPDLAEAVGGKRFSPDRIPESISWTEYSALKARLRKFSGIHPWIQLVERCFGDQPSSSNGN